MVSLGMAKVMVRATSVKDLQILKEFFEEKFGTVFIDGPFPDREGTGHKMYYTFQIEVDKK